ncbi:hypothetical protein [Streptomyces sp. UG1]|uniref:hypothetical protein n=1 Tax=Streptomyces sp. UG1 TaxID=3417652 RepID=UPI003CF1B993
MPVRARVPASHLRDAEKALAEFFRTQGAAIAANWPEPKSSGKALADVFSLARWNRVLAPVVETIALAVSTAAGRSVLAGLGLAADGYDQDVTLAWIAAHASGVASGVNGRTRATVRDALAADLTASDVRDLFSTMAEARAPQIARTEVTAATGFGTREAAQQSGRDLVKTWKTGSNPRASHARLDGQAVPMNETFSNGARWPGDSRLDDKERSNCNCSMTVDAA